VFETHDFYLACFLRCTGYALIDLRAEGRRKVFVKGAGQTTAAQASVLAMPGRIDADVGDLDSRQ
jgi:hypothetical protein